MKRYIYTLFLSLLFICSCTTFNDDELTVETSSVQVLEDGSLGVSFNLSMQPSSDISVATRATSDENTIVDGWAVVFGKDESSNVGYGDNSVLLQKVAFKTASDGSAFVIFDEQEDFCFIRLLANLTDNTEQQIYALVSKKEIGDDDSATVSTFKDYKNLSVGLLGYYNDDSAPSPTSLRTNEGFPCASPGYEMPSGLSVESLKALNNSNVYMVPVGSKLDVSVDSDCDFTLSAARLYNGAKRALMRSTVLDDDGVTEISDYPLPTNFGGVNYSFGWASANSNTTSTTPIYFYPNEGDKPLKDGETATYTTTTGDGTTATEEGVTTTFNPTYVIIKGTAKGYNVEGYYKVAIKYIPSGDNSYDDQSTFDDTYSYDIVRNGHYQIKLMDVASPGYATEAEAIAGPASDITYSISVDTYGDSRNETVISSSGLYSMELNASSVYVRGWSADGIDLDIPVWFDISDEATDFDYSSQKAYIIGSDNVTITSATEISGVAAGGKQEITFNVTGDGSITIRYGDVVKEIPVYYENTSISMYGENVITVDDSSVYDSYSSFSGTLYDYTNGTYSSDVDVVSEFFSSTSNNSVAEVEGVNDFTEADEFKGRAFDGYIYPNNMSGGVIRLYCHQGMTPFHDAYTLSSDPDEDIVYYILNYEDYKHLSTAVNGDDCTAKTFEDCNFRMLVDVDLSEDDYTHSPIGTMLRYFMGSVDGLEHKVTGLKIYGVSNFQGLFGNIEGATIANLTIGDPDDPTDSSVKGGTYVGGLVGYAYRGTTITNCHNYASVTATQYFGGLVGNSTGALAYKNTITSCTNSGSVANSTTSASDYHSYGGGVVGYSRYSAFISCTNESTGSVYTNSSRAGGIAGHSGNYSSISNCLNKGSIDGDSEVGGIAGCLDATTDITVDYCTNIGLVEGGDYVGGIVGNIENDSSSATSYITTISNCSNNNTVTGSSYNVGGVVGNVNSYSTTNITYCTNTKAVSSSSYCVGGIAGYTGSNGAANFSVCVNSGDVIGEGANSSGYTYAGGVVGSLMTGTMDKCYNTAAVTGNKYYIGGLAGAVNDASLKTSITDSYNKGKITGQAIVGGAFGLLRGVTCYDCYNEGEVESTYYNNSSWFNNYSNTGGIVGGIMSCTLSRCYNIASINSEYGTTGGIVGAIVYDSDTDFHYTYIINCYNTGDINGEDNVAGIAGYITGGRVYYSYNTGAVYAEASSSVNAGGIVGYLSTLYSHNYLRNCYNAGSVGSGNKYGTYVKGIVGYYYDPITYSYNNYCYSCYFSDALDLSDNKGDSVSDTVMKSESFVQTLNDYSSVTSFEVSEWAYDSTSINGGYPVFTWQQQ